MAVVNIAVFSPIGSGESKDGIIILLGVSMRRTLLTLTLALSGTLTAAALYLGYEIKNTLDPMPKRSLASLQTSADVSAPQEKLNEMANTAEGKEGGPEEHGASKANAGNQGKLPLISMEEIFVNIGDAKGPSRSLGVKLELELFEKTHIDAFDKHQAGIRNTVIVASREQDFKKLSTVQGKLYFKEHLIAVINEYLRQPAVRDIHFASFFLQ